MYHEVLPDDVDLPIWTAVRESEFVRQMVHLRKHFDVVSNDTALDRVSRDCPASKRTRPFAVVTFDDGYQGNFNYALPVMERLGLPFTVFVVTEQVELGGCQWYDKVIVHLLSLTRPTTLFRSSQGPVDFVLTRVGSGRRWARIDRVLAQLKALPECERQRLVDSLPDERGCPELRMLTPDELRRLAASNCAEIGCHTHGHELLDRLPEDQAREFIVRANSFIESCTDQPPRHFSYPNRNYRQGTRNLVADMGFASACTTESRFLCSNSDPYEIPRIGIGRFDSINLFRAKLAGFVR